MKTICLPLLILFSFVGWSQENAEDGYEILKITNFAGQTGIKNAVKINFPGKVELSRIEFSYSFQKFPESLSETIPYDKDFTSVESTKKKELVYNEKSTSTVFKVKHIDPQTIEFYIELLDKNKKKARFNWEEIEQPKIYPNKKQKEKKPRHKRRYNKWLLSDLTIYAKEKPAWFDKKDPRAPYPKLSIENLLLSFSESKRSIAPHVIFNNLQNVESVKISQPSSADLVNCTKFKYKYNGEDYEFERVLKIDEGNSNLDFEFLNNNGVYEEDYLTCQPKIDLMFLVSDSVIPPPLEVVDADWWRVHNTTLTTVEHTDPVKTKEEGCKCGTKGGGSVEVGFIPQQRKTEIYRNIQYRIIKNNSTKEIIPVIQREPIFEISRTDTAFITDVEIKLRHQSEVSYWNLEKKPRYQRAQYKKTGNRQINIDSLDSGIYDLKVSWKLKGIDIDTTIKIPSGDVEILKKIDSIIHVSKKIDSITYVDEIPFTITPGGKCGPKYTLQATHMEKKCLTLKGDEGCTKSISIDASQGTSKYLLIGLDRGDLGRNKLEDIINSNVYGEPEEFTIKAINCIDCEKYEKNDVEWNGAKLNQHILIDLDKLGRKKPIVLTADILEGDGPLDVFYQFISVSSEK